MALKSGMTLILPLEILLVYMCLEGDWRISIYLNMYNDIIMFWILISGLFCIKLRICLLLCDYYGWSLI